MVEHEKITDPAELAALEAAINDIARVDAPAARSIQCEAINNGHKCPATADRLVRLHQWGECDNTGDNAADAQRIDADGNVTAFMCGPCSGFALIAAWRAIRQLQARIPASLWPITCPKCSRPTMRGEDLCTVEMMPT